MKECIRGSITTTIPISNAKLMLRSLVCLHYCVTVWRVGMPVKLLLPQKPQQNNLPSLCHKVTGTMRWIADTFQVDVPARYCIVIGGGSLLKPGCCWCSVIGCTKKLLNIWQKKYFLWLQFIFFLQLPLLRYKHTYQKCSLLSELKPANIRHIFCKSCVS